MKLTYTMKPVHTYSMKLTYNMKLTYDMKLVHRYNRKPVDTFIRIHVYMYICTNLVAPPAYAAK